MPTERDLPLVCSVDVSPTCEVTGSSSLTAAATTMPDFRMLLVDDHAIVREGLKHLLCAKGSNWAVVEAETGFQALELLHKSKFDLALVDLSMPGMNGLELIRASKAEFPGVRVLVLSMHAEEQYALRAFKAGADGYVTKDMAATELIYAVRKVAAGGAYVTESLAESVIRQLNGARGSAPCAADRSRARHLATVRGWPSADGNRPRASSFSEDGEHPQDSHPGEAACVQCGRVDSLCAAQPN